ncbi:flagellar basal body protein, partial [Salinibacter ruber]
MSLQSLSIGVSGLRSHQTRLDTVSNNIANSSTT